VDRQQPLNPHLQEPYHTEVLDFSGKCGIITGVACEVNQLETYRKIYMGQISVKVGHNQDPFKAIQKLKNKLIEEGLFAELKKRKYYMKPSKAKKLKREEAARTRVKDFRKAVRQAEQSDDWF